VVVYDEFAPFEFLEGMATREVVVAAGACFAPRSSDKNEMNYDKSGDVGKYPVESPDGESLLLARLRRQEECEQTFRAALHAWETADSTSEDSDLACQEQIVQDAKKEPTFDEYEQRELTVGERFRFKTISGFTKGSILRHGYGRHAKEYRVVFDGDDYDIWTGRHRCWPDSGIGGDGDQRKNTNKK